MEGFCVHSPTLLQLFTHRRLFSLVVIVFYQPALTERCHGSLVSSYQFSGANGLVPLGTEAPEAPDVDR